MLEVMTAAACGNARRDHSPQPGTVCYRVDAHDRIAELGDTWSAWAVENGAPQLARGVVGRSLWEFVGDPHTREVYRTLLARVRGGLVVRFPYRCDAPQMRRFMRMTLTPDGEGGVWFDSETVRTEPRTPCWLAARPTETPATVRTVCGWCKRVAVDDGWEEIEVAIARLDLFGDTGTPALSHGMCPACYATFMETLDPRPAD